MTVRKFLDEVAGVELVDDDPAVVSDGKDLLHGITRVVEDDGDVVIFADTEVGHDDGVTSAGLVRIVQELLAGGEVTPDSHFVIRHGEDSYSWIDTDIENCDDPDADELLLNCEKM